MKIEHHISRIIYPIGQGQCVSEFHSVKQISNSSNSTEIKSIAQVYFDCGVAGGFSKSKANLAEMNRILAYPVEAVKRYLFISHFHYDHISHVPQLLKNRNITKIFFPKLAIQHHILALLQVVVFTPFSQPLNSTLLRISVADFSDLNVDVVLIDPDITDDRIVSERIGLEEYLAEYYWFDLCFGRLIV